MTSHPDTVSSDPVNPQTMRCPCGSQASYADCCQRWHQGRPAPGPEALMRSRYTAFVLKLADYLLATWHPDTRPTPAGQTAHAGDKPKVRPQHPAATGDRPEACPQDPAAPGDRPRVCPHELLGLDHSPAWTSLQVFDSATTGDRGSVHFRALYRAGSGWGYLEEHSDFLREAGRWYYLSGRTTEGTLKPGRNDPCPCGSGKKYKACCL